MKHFFLNVVTGLSIALCAAACFFYFISNRFVVDMAVQDRARTWFRIQSEAEIITFEIQTPTGTFDRKMPLGWPLPQLRGILINGRWVDPTEEIVVPSLPEPSFAGFGTGHGITSYPPIGIGEWHRYRSITIPFWLVILPFAVLPGVRLYRRARAYIARASWTRSATAILFKGSVVPSMIFLCLFIGLWVRSYHMGDQVRKVWAKDYKWYHIRREWMLEAGLGGIGFYADRDVSRPIPDDVNPFDQNIATYPYEEFWEPRYPYRMDPHPGGGADPWQQRTPIAGFYFQDVTVGMLWMRQVTVPIWSLVMLSSITPSIWIVRYYRSKRKLLKEYCVRCGYDLRATPERCPECGNITPPQTAAKCHSASTSI